MSLIATDRQRIILGLGATGLSCVRHLSRLGQSFRVMDNRDQPPGLDALKRDYPDVDVVLGEWDVAALCAADELIVSPGIPLSEPALKAAAEAGVKILGDIELFAAQARAPIAAITGSNGKSTVTTLLGEMAAQAGVKVAVGGNLGTPALDLLSGDIELYVLEVSSFQLERCSGLGAAVATVLNMSEDHLDHHGSMVAYHRAKHRIFESAKAAVINGDDPLSRPLLPDDTPRRVFRCTRPDIAEWGLIDEGGQPWLGKGREPLIPVADLKIVGRHNLANALAALAMGELLGIAEAPMIAALRDFNGLPHRCQFVLEQGGVAWYDDSKGTNVGAAIASIKGIRDSRGPVVLVAGGRGKGGGFGPLMDCLCECGSGAVFLGESAEQLQAELKQRLPSETVSSMDEAVRAADALAGPGESVLLSPACASFDMYSDYKARGLDFQRAVHALAGGRAS